MTSFMPEWTDGKVVVYVHRDSRGRALYIGMSNQPWKRWLTHLENSPWAMDVARIEYLGEYDSRSEAFAVEAEAIRAFQPSFNKNERRIATRVHPTIAMDAESPFKLGTLVAER